MIYTDFNGEQLSLLGFGLMRLPVADGEIDRKQVSEMLDMAISNGVNYFDTAWPYHDGKSETVIGDLLQHYSRISYNLADKYPGHQHFTEHHPEQIFEKQLEKCKTEYFDYYLMHNICENSIEDYFDPRWKLLDYFLEQKQQGRIRHLGFSSHADVPTLKRFLDSEWGKHMEFCQIQLNYLDWTLQHAKEKVELLNERRIPIWCMEPLRGGRLVEPTAAEPFRWLQEVKGVQMILSGMSTKEQMIENIQIFSKRSPLTEVETTQLMQKAKNMLSDIPCTGCRYCCNECPQHLDIPAFMHALNDFKVTPEGQITFTPIMYIESLPEHLQPSACLGCGACSLQCPQNIDIPSAMKELSERYSKAIKWSEICNQRNALAASEK